VASAAWIVVPSGHPACARLLARIRRANGGDSVTTEPLQIEQRFE
jgi:hypothetical protein